MNQLGNLMTSPPMTTFLPCSDRFKAEESFLDARVTLAESSGITDFASISQINRTTHQ
jgi:hypothetical protein